MTNDPTNSLLPPGFSYPDRYVSFVSDPKRSEISPWFLLAEREDLLGAWLAILRQRLPDLFVLPFAKWGVGDEVAAFEAGAETHEPSVVVVNAFDEPGWALVGRFATFGAWLDHARQQAKEFADAELEAP